MTGEIFYRLREPDPRFVQALRNLYPRSERHSWLEARWLAGTPEDPIQRWAIYQMYPAMVTPNLLWSPAQRVVFMGASRVPDPAWPLSLDRRSMHREQWELYLETGCAGQLFWIVQGEHGGHKRRFTHAEKSILQMVGLAGEAPIPGTRPFAALDARVLAKLAEIDRMRVVGAVVDAYQKRPGDRLDADERGELLRMRAEMWKWLETQVDEAIEPAVVSRLWGRIRSDAPEGDRRLEEKLERERESFLAGA